MVYGTTEGLDSKIGVEEKTWSLELKVQYEQDPGRFTRCLLKST